MSRKVIYAVIILAFVSLSGVVLTQMYWVSRAYGLREKEFNDRVIIAMTAVVGRIQALNRDSALVEPVKQESSNFFIANINDTLHPYLLESLLKEEFTHSNLKDDFEYGIYDCFNDSIVFGGRLTFSGSAVSAMPEEVSIQKRFDRDGHYFGIYYPNKTNLLLGKMDFWMYSSLVILLVVVFFSYTIMVILKQRRLSEVKNDFINNMTHELKTPISSIALSADMIMKSGVRLADEQLQNLATIVKSENERLKLQVDKVLQVATLSPEKMNLKREKLDFHEIIERALASVSLRVGQANGTLTVSLKANASIIYADKVHLTNVVYNLLDNAIKYADGPPHIQIVTINIDDSILLQIIDRGIGIAPKHLTSVFEKFFRVPTGNLHDVKGFGLGLYYVKTLIKSHGGMVIAAPNPGGGSIFTVSMKTFSSS